MNSEIVLPAFMLLVLEWICQISSYNRKQVKNKKKNNIVVKQNNEVQGNYKKLKLLTTTLWNVQSELVVSLIQSMTTC